uniref:Uncharacterized protein n=1 Tax=Tanacetum cinerariifolium TaxID=118510 RepID=A0A6L2J1W2_TANCI|nr:hypothetical protein [Tanacetum cinerariifolium]
MSWSTCYGYKFDAKIGQTCWCNDESHSVWAAWQKLHSGQKKKDVESETAEFLELFHTSKMSKGQYVGLYVLNVMSYVKQLGRLGTEMPEFLVVELILSSLPLSYNSFVTSYDVTGAVRLCWKVHRFIADKKNHQMRAIILSLKYLTDLPMLPDGDISSCFLNNAREKAQVVAS